jgi:hypothetical protein
MKTRFLLKCAVGFLRVSGKLTLKTSGTRRGPHQACARTLEYPIAEGVTVSDESAFSFIGKDLEKSRGNLYRDVGFAISRAQGNGRRH